MKTKLIILAVLLAVIAAGIFSGGWKRAATEKAAVPDNGYMNETYTINGAAVKLDNGYAETVIVPGAASKLVTSYFGNEAFGDLNGDGIDDVAFIITQSGGGSGTFYYAVAALKTPSGYEGTNGILLGDRIAPQPTQITDRKIIVNYATRKPSEPMTARPSVGVSKYLRVENGKLVETGI